MRVLVTYASKHGATADIARAIGAVLTRHGLETAVLPVAEAQTLPIYDAVVLGSAVYMGRWLDEAKDFAYSNQDTLTALRIWLFTSGPIGEPLSPYDEPEETQELARRLNAKDRRSFAGRLEPRTLGFLERAAIHFVHAPEGDYRDWKAVSDWAITIARQLLASRTEEDSSQTQSIAATMIGPRPENPG
jgi:menaquinone-dependent protoporphyrinogen oxidase